MIDQQIRTSEYKYKNYPNNLPQSIKKNIAVWNFFLLIFAILQMLCWSWGLFFVGRDIDQGNIYRIMFVHVPIAWCAFFWIIAGAALSVCTLFANKNLIKFDLSAHSAMQLGTLFSFLVLITGSIWGRPTWGVWWDWDPRLTSSLVMFIIAAGYLILRHTTPEPIARAKMSALVSILCAINVPIVYYSVNLWRSLHQPQSFVNQTGNVSKDIVIVLVSNCVAMFLLSIAIYKIKRQALSAKETLETARSRLS